MPSALGLVCYGMLFQVTPRSQAKGKASECGCAVTGFDLCAGVV